METSGWLVICIIGVALIVILYLLPTYIAFKRNHDYRWIIFAINLILGASGLGWLTAFIWAVWPASQSLPVRVVAEEHTCAAKVSANQQISTAASTGALDAIDRLASLEKKGVITPEEFAAKKISLLKYV